MSKLDYYIDSYYSTKKIKEDVERVILIEDMKRKRFGWKLNYSDLAEAIAKKISCELERVIKDYKEDLKRSRDLETEGEW
jgi:hypothetical protein